MQFPPGYGSCWQLAHNHLGSAACMVNSVLVDAALGQINGFLFN